MAFLSVRNETPLALSEPLTAHHGEARLYQPPPGLTEAIDVSMLLGEPLVLTGKPGTGKTQAAVWLASRLQTGDLLRFDVKSTTLGVDLLYSFDDVARFRDASSKEGVKPLVKYLRFSALGMGILRAAGGQAVLCTPSGAELKDELIAENIDLLREAFGPDWAPTDNKVYAGELLPHEPKFRHADREVKVVLIDELDKAPRDTPNDLLAEVEGMTFLIQELGLRVKTDRAVRPIVIITSNSEKSLPEPFLRRCAYFDVPFVRDEALQAIIARTVFNMDGPERLAQEASDMMDRIQESDREIQRKPGTAELLAWLEVVVKLGSLSPSSSLREWVRTQHENARSKRRDLLAVSLGALLKSKDDQENGRTIINDWANVRDGKPNPARA